MNRVKYLLFVVLLICDALLIPAALKSTDGKNGKKEMIEQVRQYRSRHEHQVIGEFFDLLSIPNVSLDKENIAKNALFIKTMLEKRGIVTELLETPGNPVIYGELKAPGAQRTLLFYIHYDGQPVDPSQWIDSQPFQPVLRPAKMEAGTNGPKPIPLPAAGVSFQPDWRIYARSSSDDKTPIICILTALDALQNSGFKLKNNIKFILDGEEEISSSHMAACLEKNKSKLGADVLLMCDGPAYFSGDPTLFFGVRGIVTIEITVYGPNVSLHSGHYGNWAVNPAVRLAQLLATMKDDQGKVTIKGFYDTAVPLSPTEIKAIRAIPGFESQLKELYGFCSPENSALSLMESTQYPSFNIHGLRSGWVGEEARTIIPPYALASIDMRLVKGEEPQDMVKRVIAHITSQGYQVITHEPLPGERQQYPRLARVRVMEEGYPASRTPMDLPICRQVMQAFHGIPGLQPVLLPSLGGSLPVYIFADILQVPIIGVSIVNYDNNQHQPNENLRIGHLWQGIETYAALLMMQ